MCVIMIKILPVGCKGICIRFQNIGGGKYSAYRLGYKRCSECGIYIKYQGIRCPCCRYPLRSNRRSSNIYRKSEKSTKHQ